jgi:hypothetical protein
MACRRYSALGEYMYSIAICMPPFIELDGHEETTRREPWANTHTSPGRIGTNVAIVPPR